MSHAKSIETRINQLKEGSIPRHIGIIMDGNGRWATLRGLARLKGHRAGVEAVDRVLETVMALDVDYLTVYAFSTENWKRPTAEVRGLMALLVEYLDAKLDKLMANGVCLKAIGDKAGLPEKVQVSLNRVEEKTKANTGLYFNIALNYGGRQEIVRAARALAEEVQAGSRSLEDITEESLADKLYTAGQPDPDFIIRSSGEFRISNFMLWQMAYAELWLTDTLWPDFSADDLLDAIADYQKRNRRFGGIDAKGKV